MFKNFLVTFYLDKIFNARYFLNTINIVLRYEVLLCINLEVNFIKIFYTYTILHYPFQSTSGYKSPSNLWFTTFHHSRLEWTWCYSININKKFNNSNLVRSFLEQREKRKMRKIKLIYLCLKVFTLNII